MSAGAAAEKHVDQLEQIAVLLERLADNERSMVKTLTSAARAVRRIRRGRGQGGAATKQRSSADLLNQVAQLLDVVAREAPRELRGCAADDPRARAFSDALTAAQRAMRAATTVLERIC